MPAVRFFTVILVWFVTFGAQATAPKATLKPFASEAELQALLKGWKREFERRRTARAESYGVQSSAAPAASPALSSAKAAEADSITNVQHAGVDEGGIVKLHGEHLVILRRGRLFTVEVAGLRPVST